MAPTLPSRAQMKASGNKSVIPSFNEIVAPVREKPYVSTASLFKAAAHARVQKHRATRSTRHTTTPSSTLPKASHSTRKAGLGKSILVKRASSPSPPPAPPSSTTHPVIADLNSTLAAYRDSVTVAARVALKPIHAALAERLVSKSSDDQHSATDDLTARFNQAMELSKMVGKPLGEHEVKVRFKDSQGNLTSGKVVLGATVSSFATLLKKERNKLSDLWLEWDQVRQEIAELGGILLGDSSFPLQFGLEAAPISDQPSLAARAGFDGHINHLRDEVRLLCEKSRNDLTKEAQDQIRNRRATRDQWLEMLKKEL